jgi:hypothetical protein
MAAGSWGRRCQTLARLQVGASMVINDIAGALLAADPKPATSKLAG